MAELVVHKFSPAVRDGGQKEVFLVSFAYRSGLRQHAQMELGFVENDPLAHDAVRAALEEVPREEWMAAIGNLRLNHAQIDGRIDAF